MLLNRTMHARTAARRAVSWASSYSCYSSHSSGSSYFSRAKRVVAGRGGLPFPSAPRGSCFAGGVGSGGAPEVAVRFLSPAVWTQVAAFSGGSGKWREKEEEEEEEKARQRCVEAEGRKIEQMNEREAPQSRLGQLLVGVPVLGALLGKSKYLLVGAKLLKFKSLLSLLASVGVYSVLFGLPYAVGVVSMLAVHEAGHALVMLQRGIPVGAITFIPFLGASVSMKKRPKDAFESAVVAFGGPVIGGLGALAVSAAGMATGNQMLLAVADWGLMINALNMMPLGQLDGGHIAGAMSKHFLLAGVGMGVAAAYLLPIHNPIFYVILALGGYQTFQRYRGTHGEREGYYRIPRNQKIAIGLGYFATIAALFAAWQFNKRRLMPLATLRAAKEEGTLEQVQNLEYINNSNDVFAPDDEVVNGDMGMTFFEDTEENEARRRDAAELEFRSREHSRTQQEFQGRAAQRRERER